MTMFARLLLAIILVSGLAAPAAADEFKPAYFRVHRIGADSYDLLWKVPALDEQTTLSVRPVLPDGTEQLGPPRAIFAAGATVIRWQVRVPGGIEGKVIRFSNLSRTRIDVLARYERGDGTEQVKRVLPVDPSFIPQASPGPYEVIATYTRIGTEHILFGVDHLLFVLALLMIVRGTKRLLTTVTAFTIAHSITLVLATLNVIRIPGPPVEATIALSIVFVASEILRMHQGKEGLAARKPWVVAFAFGLLHGLGFAGALAEIGLPENAIPLALLFFNVGVEIGQVTFIFAVLAFMAIARKLAGPRLQPHWARVATTYTIGTLASFWLFERVAAFVA